MKHIIKNPEPAELLDWKATDRFYIKGDPRWGRIPATVKEVVRESLKAEQGGICCYCERYLQANDYHIEHIKPKGIKVYDNLLAEYENLLCCCQFELQHGHPRHCGNSKGSWYDDTLFVSPLHIGCEDRFSYTFDGYIEPTDPNDTAAATTIFRLQLDIPKLRALRQSLIRTLEEFPPEELTDFVRGYLADKSENDGEFGQFYTTIKQLFGHLII